MSESTKYGDGIKIVCAIGAPAKQHLVKGREMARKAGGYRKSQDVEWAECARLTYGEAIVSAASMGQDVFVWMNDAIQHHVYRCEQLQAKERYQADMQHAHDTGGISPMQYEPRYQVTRQKPEITRPTAGQGSGPAGRSYRP